MPHLKLDKSLIDEARALAQHIVAPIIDYISAHTTVTIERTTLRLIGVDGVDEEGVLLPNRVVDSALPLLSGGILRPFVSAMLTQMTPLVGKCLALSNRAVKLSALAVGIEGAFLVGSGVEWTT